MTITGEELAKWQDNFEKGAPLASVDPATLKDIWRSFREFRRSHPSGSATAIGADALSIGSGDQRAELVMPLCFRAEVMNSLFERGVVRQFQTDGEPSDAAFQVAARMPLTWDDVAEAMLHLHLTNTPPEKAAQVKAEALEKGYDLDHPRIDQRILAALLKAG